MSPHLNAALHHLRQYEDELARTRLDPTHSESETLSEIETAAFRLWCEANIAPRNIEDAARKVA